MSSLYTLFSRSPKSPVLCCPGPVQLHKSVKRALSDTQICHRDGDFERLQENTANTLRTIAKTTAVAHKVVFVTGSGTSANETVTVALGKLGRMLIISNGEFGERIHNLALLHHEKVDNLKFGWGEKIQLDKVAKMLAVRKYASVVVVHHETSTGMLNPIARIAKLAHSHGAIIYVDAVSSLGAETFEAKRWGIDVFVSSSGKALASIPGIGIVGITPALSDRIAKVKKTVQYLDLATYISYADRLKQTPNTPSVHALAALHAATLRIVTMGLETYQSTIRDRAEQVRRSLRELGMTYYDYGKTSTSSVITCIEAGLTFNVPDLLTHMREQGIVLYGGKGELENKIFQIGHIGELSPRTMHFVMKKLRMYIVESMTRMSSKDSAELISQEISNVTH